MNDLFISNIFCLSMFFIVTAFKAVMEKFYFKDESDYKKSIKICLYGSILLITPLLLTFFVHGIIQ